MAGNTRQEQHGEPESSDSLKTFGAVFKASANGRA